MDKSAVFVAIFMSTFIAFFLPLMFSGERWRMAQEKARARRLAEARMNARLVRLNL